MPDQIKIKILDDGTIRVETDRVSGPNHLGAEQFLREISKLAGGETTIKQKHGVLGHHHGHSHGLGEGQHVHQ